MRTLAALGFAAALAGLTSSHWRRQAQPAALSEAYEARLPRRAARARRARGRCARATRRGRAARASVFSARARGANASGCRSRAWRHATGAREVVAVVGDDGAVTSARRRARARSRPTARCAAAATARTSTVGGARRVRRRLRRLVRRRGVRVRARRRAALTFDAGAPSTRRPARARRQRHRRRVGRRATRRRARRRRALAVRRGAPIVVGRARPTARACSSARSTTRRTRSRRRRPARVGAAHGRARASSWGSAVDGDGVVVGAEDVRVPAARGRRRDALEPRDGRRGARDRRARPAATRSSAARTGVYALARADGAVRWRYETGAPVALSAAAVDGGGVAYVTSTDGRPTHRRAHGRGRGRRVREATRSRSPPAVGADGAYVGADDGGPGRVRATASRRGPWSHAGRGVFFFSDAHRFFFFFPRPLARRARARRRRRRALSQRSSSSETAAGAVSSTEMRRTSRSNGAPRSPRAARLPSARAPAPAAGRRRARPRGRARRLQRAALPARRADLGLERVEQRAQEEDGLDRGGARARAARARRLRRGSRCMSSATPDAPARRTPARQCTSTDAPRASALSTNWKSGAKRRTSPLPSSGAGSRRATRCAIGKRRYEKRPSASKKLVLSRPWQLTTCVIPRPSSVRRHRAAVTSPTNTRAPVVRRATGSRAAGAPALPRARSRAASR